MKRIIGLLFTVLCFCCMLSFAAFATQEDISGPPAVSEELERIGRYMCDVDENGKVEAVDARIVLRNSVGLDELVPENAIYADANFDGKITAADARLALRTSVELEDKHKYAFAVTEKNEATCSEEGYVKAYCSYSQKTVELIIKKQDHLLPANAYCKGEGHCEVCNRIVTVEIKHTLSIDPEKGIKECVYCDYEEKYEHTHDFSKGNCSCGLNAKEALGSFMNEYVKRAGKYDEPYYLIDEYIEPLNYAAIYDEEADFSYAFCGFAVEQDGVVIYYDFYFDFEENTVEALVYTEDMAMAYAYGCIDSSKVDEAANGDAVTLEEFDVVPELYGYEDYFRQMMEGAVHDTVIWLRALSVNAGFAYIDEAFADYVNVE